MNSSSILFAVLPWILMMIIPSTSSAVSGQKTKEDCYEHTYYDPTTDTMEFCFTLCYPGGGQMFECKHSCREYLRCIEEVNRQHKLRSNTAEHHPNAAGETGKYTALGTENEETAPTQSNSILYFAISACAICVAMGVFVGLGLYKKKIGCAAKNPCVRIGGEPPTEGDTGKEMTTFVSADVESGTPNTISINNSEENDPCLT